MSIKGRIEKLEKAAQAHDPQAAKRQAEAEAAVQAILRSPQEPSPPDLNDWTDEAIQAEPWKQRLCVGFGVPIWRDGDWFCPEYGSSEYRSWPGGVSQPQPVYVKS